MLTRIVLCIFCLAMIATAIGFQPSRPRSLLGSAAREGPHLRVMTWNIGNGNLEDDSRAHTSDLKAVAETILTNDPDAVALQELTGPEQLKVLLGHLHGEYSGAVAAAGTADRVEAVLVKGRGAHFQDVSSDGKNLATAAFHSGSQMPEIVLISAHADAFKAARRRAYAEDLIDWAAKRPAATVVLIGGDFNFELDQRDKTNLYTDDVKNDSEAYSYILKYFRDLGREAGYTAVDDRRIDYLFGPAEKVVLRRAEVLRSAGVGQMDHWPLLIEITL